MRTFTKSLLLLSAFSLYSQYAFSQDITLYKKLLPKQFMVVDKEEQECILYGVDRTSEPLRYTCSSGQIDGDKEIEGDKKTPVGAYFITGSILEGLDFEEYGSRAYPLNYPNPIDTLEKKTGYGIWVHGKGNKFKTKGTRGCVAFPEKDILDIYSNFIVSYPVIIGENVTVEDAEPSEDYKAVQNAIYTWATAWSEHDPIFFSLYNSEKKADFSKFKAIKKHVFSKYRFTFASIDTPYIVRKGNFYTAWFTQYYYAPNMIVKGIRYLYWERGADNKNHIIAEEWKPLSTSSAVIREELANKLKPQVEEFLTEWKNVWEQGDIQGYIEKYDAKASQDSLKNRNAIQRAKERNWKKHKPNKITIEDIRIQLTSQGIQVRFKQIYEAEDRYKDIGEKTLYILPNSTSPSKWKIMKETWVKTK